MKKLTVGILAHVDSGKTTLSEAILYTCGALKKLGRVDNRDSFLDTESEERKRGITIFSKQARCRWKGMELTFIDTPGHVDFSGETERALQILDYAVLVISGTDGAQAHTATLVSLLEEYNIPTFIFVTKMDVTKLEREQLTENLLEQVGAGCIDFTDEIDFEAAALSDENMLEKYLETGSLSEEDLARLVKERRIFPVFFGSGLKLQNIDLLLDGLLKYTLQPEHSAELSGRVYKIARDSQGKRLSFVKLTGGGLSVREPVNGEKISQIRLYSGQKFEAVDRAEAGEVCALLGLDGTYTGQGIGSEKGESRGTLSPVLTYKVILPKGVDGIAVYPYFKELAEEDPLLHPVWNEKYGEIEIQLMGRVQTEILKSIILERYSLDVGFDSGRVLYKETIRNTVEGIGHYEPLKHYAEVHLLMEPLPRGEGLVFESAVTQDELDLNWQRLVLTHLNEKQHPGVLTGAPVTDMRISLIAGRAHLKHTEGGDFRQATYRAVRQGLMQAESILLEPMYEFTLEVPQDCTGRAINDIHMKCGTHEPPLTRGGFSVLKGIIPASETGDYASEVASYTGGKGRLNLKFAGYAECHNAEEVIEAACYDPVSDIENTPDSVFCSHGAGVNITWSEVPDYCHIPPMKNRSSEFGVRSSENPVKRQDIDEAELEAIMLREFGPIRRKEYTEAKINKAPERPRPVRATRIIIDGYNVIHSWDDLKAVALDNLDLAREKLINMLINYRSFTGIETVLVFDAYAVEGGAERKFDKSGLHIVYTEKGVSADAYIEKFVDEIGKNENVKVVSSDSMIQLTATKTGVLRVSSREFRYDVDDALQQMREKIN